MPTVKYADGTEVQFPEPKGENIRQLAKRHNLISEHHETYSEDEIAVFIDDIIYLMLDYWKEHGVDEPFNHLLRLVKEDKVDFKLPKYRDVFCRRVTEIDSLITTFKNDTGKPKESAKEELKIRGFIGGRDIATL